MMTAAGRGAHLFNYGRRAVLQDWLGWPLVGPDVEPLVATIRAMFGDATDLIANWITARSRIAEDWLLDSGAHQYVVLGAGLDSFAWRAPDGIRVFEVDHPASQQWKLSRIDAMTLSTPDCLTWVPVDFEKDAIGERLEQAGLDRSAPTFVSWLGVIPYLSADAIAGTLGQLGAVTLAVTYAPPKDEWTPEAAAVSEIFLPLAAASGETIISLFTADEFARILGTADLEVVAEVRASDVEPRFGIPAVANVEERIVLARPAAPGRD